MERLDAPILASIGTTHPWNIAGVGLDAHVAADYGLAHAAAIVAVSAQDANGLHALQTIDPQVIRAQLRSLPRGIAAYCIGALVASDVVRVVAEYLRESARNAAIVVDPVFAVSLGGSLQRDADLPKVLCEQIVALGAIVTPNLHEAQLMLAMHVRNEPEMRSAAQKLLQCGASAAIVTGGHLPGDPVDVLAGAGMEERLSGPRLPGSMRGTGSTFAAALACELAREGDLRGAAARAHAYVREKIAAGTMRGGLQVAF